MIPDQVRRRRGSVRVSLVVLAVLIVAVLLLRVMLAQRQAPPLPVLGMVPPFELTDQSSEPFSSRELAGKVWVASFIYTSCPGPCPRVVQRLAQLERELAANQHLRIVSISVDPEADTPEVLAVYAKTHAIDPTRWKLLTGPAEQVFALVRKGFLSAVERVDEADVEAIAAAGPVIHSVRLVLVDQAGRIRGFYDSDSTAALTQLTSDARSLLRRGPA